MWSNVHGKADGLLKSSGCLAELEAFPVMLPFPKGNQSRILTGRTDDEAPILWHQMQRTDSLEKTLMLGKIGAGGEGDHRG